MRTEYNVITGERLELPDYPVIQPTAAEILVATNQAAQNAIATIHQKSIGAILTWVAAQPSAPAFLRAQEALAVAERAKM